ncbi:GNAT family N-acetyltransferase [Vagococcus salmoninarum]|uniref:GNAT family N-acetyltransferase n=1 Tax=Vagococcus salmoninarum TaxID=2739 RepID=A0A429ZSG8_9ENTE|nr:GNAT family N-acetyltransferase [Vagococcus salmoninarum]MBE9388734.1 GNAT family N-acetyltransferase [Vagococcus salmoninarum]RST96690.1 GNAT family N-acetyltransferase [Vagococcus salmoninarum]
MTDNLNRQRVLAEHQVIETERLILRPITLADGADMYEYASDPETTQYVFETHTSLENTLDNIASYFLSQPLGKYAIELKATHKMIGTIDIRLVDLHHRGEIGYTINKAYWGQGITTEASQALVDLAFGPLQLKRLEAIHDVKNPASGRVMEKFGLKHEGTVPHYQLFKGAMMNAVSYGMTDVDYQKRQEQINDSHV